MYVHCTYAIIILAYFQQRDAWRQCLDFAARTSNQYVAMFALNTLENVIRRQWVGIPGNEHAEIRSTLQSFLEVHFKSAPPYIRNKLMKLGGYSVMLSEQKQWQKFQ